MFNILRSSFYITTNVVVNVLGFSILTKTIIKNLAVNTR